MPSRSFAQNDLPPLDHHFVPIGCVLPHRQPNVPAGTSTLQFLLQWQEGWSRYPSADLDLLLVNPSNTLLTMGATLNSPERVTIANPAAGNWTIVVDAFEVHLNNANYSLTMIRDGVVVKLK